MLHWPGTLPREHAGIVAMTMPTTACTPAARAALVRLSGTTRLCYDKAKQHWLHHIPADILT